MHISNSSLSYVLLSVICIIVGTNGTKLTQTTLFWNHNVYTEFQTYTSLHKQLKLSSKCRCLLSAWVLFFWLTTVIRRTVKHPTRLWWPSDTPPVIQRAPPTTHITASSKSAMDSIKIVWIYKGGEYVMLGKCQRVQHCTKLMYPISNLSNTHSTLAFPNIQCQCTVYFQYFSSGCQEPKYWKLAVVI